MGNWAEKYKKLVIPTHKRHVLVADADDLFEYSELRSMFEDDGFVVIRCKTGLAVRLAVELTVRDSEKRCLVVAPVNYNPLPDIRELMHFQTIGLAQLFPNLDSKAIKGLSFNALCLISDIKPYEELGHQKTLKFLLENLFSIDFDTLTVNRERVLSALITVFLERNDVNESLKTFLENKARPFLPELVSHGFDTNAIINFLQVQWHDYVRNSSSIVNFSDPVLSRNLGYLFAFGNLKPVHVTSMEYEQFPAHQRLGLFVDQSRQNDDELNGLNQYLHQQLGVIEDIADQWFMIIHLLSNAKLKELRSTNSNLKTDFKKVETAINKRFQRFIDNTYGSLFSLSGVRKPFVVSRILDHMKSNPSTKKALLVIDGMNFWQWQLLGQALKSHGVHFRQSASLAIVPTITAWSRQAIFKGDKPNYSEDNSKEHILFANYWRSNGVMDYQMQFVKFSVHEPLDIAIIPSDISVLGMVCNDLDNIMHGSILGDQQLEASTLQWITSSGIVKSIQDLVSRGFQIFITSDHGNVEATGIGNLTQSQKVGSLSRSKRHLRFSNEILLTAYIEQNPQLNFGKKDLSIYLKQNEAFALENTRVITHGGSHIWEVVVPFIHVHES
jgi:hypothetical protein